MVKPAKQSGRQALHAYRIQFVHPITNSKVTYTAPLPDDFKNIIHHHNRAFLIIETYSFYTLPLLVDQMG